MDSSVAAFAYLLPVPELIAGLKYGQQPHYARVLGELLAIRLAEAVSEGALRLPDTLVPVPLHAWRRFTRGFNQAELIAASVGRELSLPVANDVVKRVRNTPSQTRLSKAARRQNLRGAFVAKAVRGQRLALVDDVVTTGATVRELARTLKAAGAVDVQVWSVARA